MYFLHALEVHDSFGVQMVKLVFKDAVLRLLLDEV